MGRNISFAKPRLVNDVAPATDAGDEVAHEARFLVLSNEVGDRPLDARDGRALDDDAHEYVYKTNKKVGASGWVLLELETIIRFPQPIPQRHH